MINTALEVEMAEHVGYDRHDSAGRNGENSRNGRRTKTVLTEAGPDIDDVFPAGIACADFDLRVTGGGGKRQLHTFVDKNGNVVRLLETASDRP